MSIHSPGLLGASEDQPLKDAYIHAAKSTGNGFKVTAGWEVGRPVESSVTAVPAGLPHREAGERFGLSAAGKSAGVSWNGSRAIHGVTRLGGG